jgi:hypothetical protein
MVLHVHAENKAIVKNTEQLNRAYIHNLYQQIEFDTFDRLDPKVFEKAYQGFVNLKIAQKLNPEKEIISICDYSLSANTKRLWVIDLLKKKVLYNSFVAHGQGTGEEFASEFSNKENSHQSSIGFYVTGCTYTGVHGLSLYLHGMDEGFNSAAFQRSIVLHGAAYVCESFIKQNHRLGRSWGCPAVSATVAPQLISLLKEGTCLFAYFPSVRYFSSSYWLQKMPSFFGDKTEENQFKLLVPLQPDGDEGFQLVNK